MSATVITMPPVNTLPDAPLLTHSARRINRLAIANDASSYLEIGVQTGVTFLHVDIRYKVAVDPVFKFSYRDFENGNVSFHPVTSDQYFSELPPSHKFDLIFLDGLHTFEQTYRDFCNSLFHCHERTIWVIDDTVPSDIYSAHKVQTQAVSRRHSEKKGKASRAWHGDVYKVIFAIHDFFPGISYCTVNTGGHKQTLLWQQKRPGKPLFDNLERVSRLDYFELLHYFEALQPLPEAEALQKVFEHFQTASVDD